MLRIRWTDPAEDPEALHGWREPSLILATLFLNFFFWYAPADGFSFNTSFAVIFGSLVALVVLAMMLFLVPALAAQEARRTLFEIVEVSFGTVAGFGFRLACGALCVFWVAGMTGALGFRFSMAVLNREFSLAQSGPWLAVLVLFVFATGQQGLRASAKLASFTNKLGIALLIAAALRVRGNLTLSWSDPQNLSLIVRDVWGRIAEPLVIVGPMAFLAADFGARARTRKDVALIGVMGLAVPMVLTLFAVGLIQNAAHGLLLGNTNIQNIAVALWGGDSRRYSFAWMLVAVVTSFGTARFAVRTGTAAVSPVVKGRYTRLAVMGLALLGCVVLSLGEIPLNDALDLTAGFAASAAAVVSADYLTRKWRHQEIARVDCIGLISFLGGWAVNGGLAFWYGPFYEVRLTGSILISYGVSFALCIAGRTVVRKAQAWGA